MKQIAILLIAFYQTVLSPLLKQVLGVQALCKYTPSCSEYTKRMISKFGVLQGTRLGIERLVTCR